MTLALYPFRIPDVGRRRKAVAIRLTHLRTPGHRVSHWHRRPGAWAALGEASRMGRVGLPQVNLPMTRLVTSFASVLVVARLAAAADTPSVPRYKFEPGQQMTYFRFACPV
jgi:hypothetical protein